MPALLAILLAVFLAFPVLTGVGSRRRGDPLPVVVLSAALFPVAWTVWYVKDELLRPRAARRTPASPRAAGR